MTVVKTSVKVKERKDIKRKLKNLDREVRVALLVIGNRAVLTLVEIHKKKRPDTIGTGQTWRSHDATRVFKEGTALVIRVGPSTAYAKWGIGFGRAPGTPPPLLAIQRWVKEKPGGFGKSEEEQFAIARAVQKSIANTGTTPYRVLREMMFIERPRASRTLKLAIRKALLS